MTASPRCDAVLDPVALTPDMIEALRKCDVYAPAATPILLHGESGTGKTHLAHYIQRLSGRPGRLHVFSVGMLTASLASDELFGRVRGGFTGAVTSRMGRLAAAGGETLLLDDLQYLDLEVQQRFLQVLDDGGTYSPLGADRTVSVACRLIFATTVHPDVLMEQGRLLEDLRYRLAGCEVYVPPLRERRPEIPLLAQRALERAARQTRLDGPTGFTREALAVLVGSHWKGNVRRLEMSIVPAYLEARYAGAKLIGPEHLPKDRCPSLKYVRGADPTANATAIARAMERAGGNMSEAARLLGLSRNGLAAILARREMGGNGSRDAAGG